MKIIYGKIAVFAFAAASVLMSLLGCSNGSSDSAAINGTSNPFHFKGGDTSFKISEKKVQATRAAVDVDDTFSEICAKDNLTAFVQINFGFDKKYILTDLINADENPEKLKNVSSTSWGLNGKYTTYMWGDQKVEIIVTDTTNDEYDNGWDTEVLITLENWKGGDIDIENMFSDPKRIQIRFGAGNPPHRQTANQTGWTINSRSMRKRMVAYKDDEKFAGPNWIQYFEYDDGTEGLVYQVQLKEQRGNSSYDYFTGMKNISFTLEEADSFEWYKANDSAHVNFNDTSKKWSFTKDEYNKVDDEKNTFSE